MKKEYSHSKFHDIELKDCKYLGQGHSGRVYLMPNGKVLKIFKSSTSCKAEFDILKSVEGSPHFPKAYKLGDHYMIREYVGGINVYDYIKKYGLNRSFVLKVVDLVDHMKKLGFTKLEVRFPHLFVQEDGTLMMIDPRKSYEEYIPYPKSFSRKLKKMGLLGKFIQILEEEGKGLKWIKYIKDK